jgi:hypothetical protein
MQVYTSRCASERAESGPGQETTCGLLARAAAGSRAYAPMNRRNVRGERWEFGSIDYWLACRIVIPPIHSCACLLPTIICEGTHLSRAP